MTRIVLLAVGFGIFLGYFFDPATLLSISKDSFMDGSEQVMMIGLCVLLLFVGIDIGIEGTAFKNLKRAGLRILIFPLSIMMGTFVGAVIASLVLPISAKDSIMVGFGFGWYSLAPILISGYSVHISAISFMHNVLRELIAILIIPMVAKRIGYIETCSLPGAAAMDVCLPIVEKSTSGDIAIYSFISGLTLSFTVPIFVPFIINYF